MAQQGGPMVFKNPDHNDSGVGHKGRNNDDIHIEMQNFSHGGSIFSDDTIRRGFVRKVIIY